MPLESKPEETITVTSQPLLQSTVRQFPTCGQKLDSQIGETIRGGSVVEDNEYPWMVFIITFDLDTSATGFCGGSLIHPQYVLFLLLQNVLLIAQLRTLQ